MRGKPLLRLVLCRDGIKKWIYDWKKNGWRTADKKPVKNAELWQALDEARSSTRSSGTGSRAMPAIRRTSAATSWRARRWRRSGKGKGANPKDRAEAEWDGLSCFAPKRELRRMGRKILQGKINGAE